MLAEMDSSQEIDAVAAVVVPVLSDKMPHRSLGEMVESEFSA